MKSQHAKMGATSPNTNIKSKLAVWRDNHKLVAKQSFQQLLGKPVSTLLTLLVLAIAIALPITVYIAVNNIERWAGYSDSGLEVSLFLQHEVSQIQGQALSKKIQQWPGVSAAQYISPQQALHSLESMSGVANIASSLPHNPLPGTVVITLPHSANIETIAQQISQRAAQLSEVESQRLDLDWFKKAQALVKTADKINSVLTLILSIGVVLVISNTIKIAIEGRKQEIEVAKLVGATNSFVRRPFLYMGAWIGAGSAILALALTGAAVLVLTFNISELEKAYSASIYLQGLPFLYHLLVVLMTAILGWLGAWMICNSYIRDLDPK